MCFLRQYEICLLLARARVVSPGQVAYSVVSHGPWVLSRVFYRQDSAVPAARLSDLPSSRGATATLALTH